MNPFALHGFSFLAFYLVVGIATVFGLRWWLRQSENIDDSPLPTMTDPYLIAYLRAGKNEALRVATVALLDRGLLTADGSVLKTKNSSAVELVKRPIERSILKKFNSKGEASKIFSDVGAISACREYEKTLQVHGMIADGGIYAKRLLPVLVALGFIVGIAWAKVNLALSEGRHNVGFLIFLAIVFTLIVLVVWGRRLTGRGVLMLSDLRSLFSRLQGRAKTLSKGGTTNEAALLAAVFGLSALPESGFPFMQKLYPSSSSSGSGCGSSSSCSSGSSCGGGCGGGGCGG